MADDGRPPDSTADQLRALGRALVVEPPAPDLVASVLARVAHRPPAPSRVRRAMAAARAGLGRRRRIVAAAVAGLLLALAVGTPASARIVEWLGLGAVVVVAAPSGQRAPTGGTPEIGQEVTLAQARERAMFPIALPVDLGDADRVLISADSRVVSMVWGAGGAAVRLDQLAGRPNPLVVKKYAGDVEVTTVAGSRALWFARAHPLVYTDAQGAERAESARTAGPALVWQRGSVTLRLEGVADRDRAVDLAESVRE